MTNSGMHPQQTVMHSVTTRFSLQEHLDFSLVHVSTRHDSKIAAQALSRELDMSVPCEPNRAITDVSDKRVLWFGPKRWLVHVRRAGWQLGDIAGCVITDLSDSRRLFTVSGEQARARLATACPLDLAGEACTPTHCALTQFQQFSVLLHINDCDSYDLYVEQSFGEELVSVLACR